MFNFSMGELSLVLIVALLALGPKQLPAIAHKAGQWIKRWRMFGAQLKSEMDQFKLQQQLSQNEQRAQTADVEYKKKPNSLPLQKVD